MCAALGYLAVFQNKNLIAVENGSQSMGDEDTRPRLLLNNAVYILE